MNRVSKMDFYSGILKGKKRKITRTAVSIEDKGMNSWQRLGARHPKTSQRGVLAVDKTGAGSGWQRAIHPLQGSWLSGSSTRPCLSCLLKLLPAGCKKYYWLVPVRRRPRLSVDLVCRSRSQTPGGVNPYSLDLVPEILHEWAILVVPFTFLGKLKIVVKSMYCRVGLDINPGRKINLICLCHVFHFCKWE